MLFSPSTKTDLVYFPPGLMHKISWIGRRIGLFHPFPSNITRNFAKVACISSMSTKEMLTDEKYDVRIQSDGQVKINIPQVNEIRFWCICLIFHALLRSNNFGFQYVKCICRLSIEQFPFDTQFCAVALASPLLTVEEMDVDAHMPPKDSYFAVSKFCEEILQLFQFIPKEPIFFKLFSFYAFLVSGTFKHSGG